MSRLRALSGLAFLLLLGFEEASAGSFVWNRSNTSLTTTSIAVDPSTDGEMDTDGPISFAAYSVMYLVNSFTPAGESEVLAEGYLLPNTDGQAFASLLAICSNMVNIEDGVGATGAESQEFEIDYELEQLDGTGGTTDGHAEIIIDWGTTAANSGHFVDIRLDFPDGGFMLAYVNGSNGITIEYWLDDVTLASSASSITAVTALTGSVALAADFEITDGQIVHLNGESGSTAGNFAGANQVISVQNGLDIQIEISAAQY